MQVNSTCEETGKYSAHSPAQKEPSARSRTNHPPLVSAMRQKGSSSCEYPSTRTSGRRASTRESRRERHGGLGAAHRPPGCLVVRRPRLRSAGSGRVDPHGVGPRGRPDGFTHGDGALARAPAAQSSSSATATPTRMTATSATPTFIRSRALSGGNSGPRAAGRASGRLPLVRSASRRRSRPGTSAVFATTLRSKCSSASLRAWRQVQWLRAGAANASRAGLAVSLDARPEHRGR